MKSHASGGATSSRPPPDAPPPGPDTKPPPTNSGGGAGVVKPPAAVKKGFLGSGGGGGGVLYGEEGSREGGKGGRGNKLDPEFDRLVALADPEMGDGAGGAADGKVEKLEYFMWLFIDIFVVGAAACSLFVFAITARACEMKKQGGGRYL